jgi:epsilon-lactone hydrolase
MPSPQHQAVLDLFLSAPPRELPLAKRRSGFDALGSREPVPDDISVTSIEDEGVRGEWIVAPEARPELVVQYLHGGGYTMGSLRSHRELAARVSVATRARVLLVDYRLAPEHRHPAALDDAVAAYRFLLAQGYSSARLGIMGDSSGGGLTVATLGALRHLGEPLPAAAVCMSPWVNLAATSDELQENADKDPVLSAAMLRESALSYADQSNLTSPSVSPVYGDLSGLPPLLVQVSTTEMFTMDARRLVAEVLAANGSASLDEYQNLLHAFQFLAPTSPEAAIALKRAGAFVQEHLNR